ncbi:hypothetical protein ACIRVK_36420 [Streptomyces sp. NPDC101152]|uniref:hypothetical protein n=1 Tax=Streptomyces sp. NPDC101152 TaxID=3366116 RepID=UPI0037FA97CB
MPGELAAGATTPPPPAPADDDRAVGLRKAAEHHLPGVTLAALRFARANDPAFPGSIDKRGAELFYRVGDLSLFFIYQDLPGLPMAFRVSGRLTVLPTS